MKLSSLQVDRKYPITHVKRVGTRFGPAIVLTIRDTPDQILEVFMPRRFYSAFSDEDLEEINSKKKSREISSIRVTVSTHTPLK